MSSWLDQLLVYHPAPWQEHDWARLSGLPLEDVWFRASDGVRLFGWYVRAPNVSAKSPTLLWCHGNAGNILYRLDNLKRLYQVGLSAFLFDYRGYGRSQGTPSEKGLYRDALAAYAYLTSHRHIKPQRLVLFGRSLGAAIAADVAAQQRAAGLILESSFPSVEAVARAHYFGLPAHRLLDARYDLLKRLQQINMPTLVIHGDRDQIIPVELGHKVYEATKHPKSFYLVSGAGHNNLYWVGGSNYFHRLKLFAEEVTR